MIDTQSYVESAVERVIQHFRKCPACYFTEEDVRWRLMKEIEDALATVGLKQVKLKDKDRVTSLVHGEYPTPFRCSMGNRSFAVLSPEELKGQRGHFDIVVLNPVAAAECEFEVIRSQYYRLFRNKLQGISLPVLDHVIEIKLFRDLAHPNRTESTKQQAEYAAQAVYKVAATLDANVYYTKPFTKRGIVLLFDNSDLACAGDVELARNRFREVFDKTTWDSIPNTLLCIWVTPLKRVDYRGKRDLSAEVHLSRRG